MVAGGIQLIDLGDGQVQAPATPYPTGAASTGAMPSGTGVMPYSTFVPATGAAATAGPVAGLMAIAGIAVALL